MDSGDSGYRSRCPSVDFLGRLGGLGPGPSRYLQSLTVPGLAIAEVMEFADHFYAGVVEERTGVHAMELLIDKDTDALYPEYGPNMMRNTKYGMHSGSGWRGMMGGMMGGSGTQEPSADMPASASQALQYAQRYLEACIPGTQVADEADGFYGYYTIHFLKDGQIYGMLSVNGYSGQVWYHNWHGQFVEMLELDEDQIIWPEELRKMARDPVCGMEVDEKTAAAQYEYKGKIYYFCA